MRRTIIFACALTMVLAAGAFPAAADPGRGANVLCYLWAHNGSSAIGAPFTPSPTYSYNAQNRSGGNIVTRTGVGQYTVTCRGVGGGAPWGPGGHVQVTAYGGDADYCKVVSWATGGADFSATVRCFNPAGALSDNQFDLLFAW